MEELLKRKREFEKMIDSLYYDVDFSDVDELIDRRFELFCKAENMTQEERDEYIRISREIDEAKKRKYFEADEKRKKIRLLYSELKQLKKEIQILTPPVISGDRVELKRFTDELENDYSIFLKGTNEIIGKIDFRGYHTSDYCGDVGVKIDEEYRGNHYFYEALCLLSDLLFKNNVEDFWISTYEDNLPSLKTIQRYGGELLDSINPRLRLFQCKTRCYDFCLDNGVKK